MTGPQFLVVSVALLLGVRLLLPQSGFRSVLLALVVAGIVLAAIGRSLNSVSLQFG